MKKRILSTLLFITLASSLSLLSAAEPETSSKVDVNISYLNKKESKKQFKTRRVFKYSRPAYLRIKNNSPKPVSFTDKNIKYKSYSSKEMFDMCEYNSTARAISWASTGFFTSPLICIPGAVIDGACAEKSNGCMKTRFDRMQISYGEIAPGETRQGFIFLSNDCPMEEQLEIVF